MSASVRLVSVQEAYEDILQRTLSRISCDLARLVYLASTRDYNTGIYHHDGLAVRFTPDVARKALEIAHRQVFYRVSAYSLEELTMQVEMYMKSSRENPLEVLRTWQNLEPYRIAIPAEVNFAVARLFLSNVRLALAIFRHRQKQLPAHP
jgi:hypothetical protein